MIYIVIPTFNEKKYIVSLLNDLSNQTYKKYKIVVSDNGSDDGTIELIQQNNEVVLIENNSKFWWTKSTNAGVKYALKNAGKNDYVLTLNCDLSIKNNYLEKIVSSAKSNKDSIIGSLNIDIDSKRIFFGGVLVNEITAKYYNINQDKKISTNKFSNEYVTHFLPGRGTLIPIKVFKKIGLYDEKLPHYGSDFEFAYRARKNHYNLIVSYDSKVFSFTKNTGLNNSINSMSFKDYLRSFFNIKSPSNLYFRAIFIYKCFPKKYFILHLFFDFLRNFGGSLLRQLGIKS
jgi:GT2 family glycosyltransferase